MLEKPCLSLTWKVLYNFVNDSVPSIISLELQIFYPFETVVGMLGRVFVPPLHTECRALDLMYGYQLRLGVLLFFPCEENFVTGDIRVSVARTVLPTSLPSNWAESGQATDALFPGPWILLLMYSIDVVNSPHESGPALTFIDILSLQGGNPNKVHSEITDIKKSPTFFNSGYAHRSTQFKKVAVTHQWRKLSGSPNEVDSIVLTTQRIWI